MKTKQFVCIRKAYAAPEVHRELFVPESIVCGSLDSSFEAIDVLTGAPGWDVED
jgi:hypothetical protein